MFAGGGAKIIVTPLITYENKETAVTDLAIHPLLVAAHAVARIHHYVLAGIVDAALVAAYLTGLRQHPPLHQAQ